MRRKCKTHVYNSPISISLFWGYTSLSKIQLIQEKKRYTNYYIITTLVKLRGKKLFCLRLAK